jgi:hypothetical protein
MNRPRRKGAAPLDGNVVGVFNDEFDAAFFTVFDNGEPGAGNDTISEVFFDNVVEPSACQFIGADDFPQIPIEGGNVTVRE